MKRFVIATAVALVAALAVTVPARAAGVPDDAPAAIEAGHSAYINGLENGNAAVLAALFTDDATQLPANAPPVRGREAIRQNYERTFRSIRIVQGSLHTTELLRRGDITYDMGEYSFDFDSGGKYGHSSGRYLTVWRKVAGVWKIDLNTGQADVGAH